MKKLIVLVLALVFVLSFVSCGGNSNTTNPSSNQSTNSVGSSNNTNGGNSSEDDANIPDTPPTPDTPIGPGSVTSSSSSNGGSTDNPGDGGNNKPQLDTTKQTVSGILGSALDVFDQKDTFGGEGQISSYTKYTAEFNLADLSAGARIYIPAGGTYRVYGKALDNQIYIKASDQNVIILLDNVDLTSTSSAPAIYAEDCKSVTIVLAEGSQNRLEDSSINGENGVIKVKSCNLTLDGKGSLEIVANAKHGISNTKELTINGGTYNITSTRHGIYGKLGVTINGGKFVINSARSGIKSGDDEIGNEAEGNIVINSGSLHIRCNTDGLNAIGTVEINNGRLLIEALSRGIDATKDVNIKGGTVIFNTEKDAVRTSKTVYDVYDADGDGDKTEVLTFGGAVSIEGNANVRINTYGNGFEGENVKISTSGVIYIKTVEKYTEDQAGEYKLVNGSYVLIGENETFNGTRYSLSESKGIEAENEIRITNSKIGIDSFEDCLNATTVLIRSSVVALNTTKDAIEASHTTNTASVTIEGAGCDVTVISAEKGIKANNSVTLSDGNTKINADTDAIKAENISILSGKHILFDKVEYTGKFNIKRGMVLCISTTENPISARSEIPNAYGTVNKKDLCVFGRKITVQMGDIIESVVLPKDYTEKISIFFAAEDVSMSDTTITIDTYTQKLTKGKLN